MKTRTPANNVKNFRRARAIHRLEARLKLPDAELLKTAKRFKISNGKEADLKIAVKSYREEMTQDLASLKALQTKKGGSL